MSNHLQQQQHQVPSSSGAPHQLDNGLPTQPLNEQQFWQLIQQQQGEFASGGTQQLVRAAHQPFLSNGQQQQHIRISGIASYNSPAGFGFQVPIAFAIPTQGNLPPANQQLVAPTPPASVVPPHLQVQRYQHIQPRQLMQLPLQPLPPRVQRPAAPPTPSPSVVPPHLDVQNYQHLRTQLNAPPRLPVEQQQSLPYQIIIGQRELAFAQQIRQRQGTQFLPPLAQGTVGQQHHYTQPQTRQYGFAPLQLQASTAFGANLATTSSSSAQLPPRYYVASSEETARRQQQIYACAQQAAADEAAIQTRRRNQQGDGRQSNTLETIGGALYPPPIYEPPPPINIAPQPQPIEVVAQAPQRDPVVTIRVGTGSSPNSTTSVGGSIQASSASPSSSAEARSNSPAITIRRDPSTTAQQVAGDSPGSNISIVGSIAASSSPSSSSSMPSLVSSSESEGEDKRTEDERYRAREQEIAKLNLLKKGGEKNPTKADIRANRKSFEELCRRGEEKQRAAGIVVPKSTPAELQEAHRKYIESARRAIPPPVVAPTLAANCEYQLRASVARRIDLAVREAGHLKPVANAAQRAASSVVENTRAAKRAHANHGLATQFYDLDNPPNVSVNNSDNSRQLATAQLVATTSALSIQTEQQVAGAATTPHKRARVVPPSNLPSSIIVNRNFKYQPTAEEQRYLSSIERYNTLVDRFDHEYVNDHESQLAKKFGRNKKERQASVKKAAEKIGQSQPPPPHTSDASGAIAHYEAQVLRYGQGIVNQYGPHRPGELGPLRTDFAPLQAYQDTPRSVIERNSCRQPVPPPPKVDSELERYSKLADQYGYSWICNHEPRLARKFGANAKLRKRLADQAAALNTQSSQAAQHADHQSTSTTTTQQQIPSSSIPQQPTTSAATQPIASSSLASAQRELSISPTPRMREYLAKVANDKRSQAANPQHGLKTSDPLYKRLADYYEKNKARVSWQKWGTDVVFVPKQLYCFMRRGAPKTAANAQTPDQHPNQIVAYGRNLNKNNTFVKVLRSARPEQIGTGGDQESCATPTYATNPAQFDQQRRLWESEQQYYREHGIFDNIAPYGPELPAVTLPATDPLRTPPLKRRRLTNRAAASEAVTVTKPATSTDEAVATGAIAGQSSVGLAHGVPVTAAQREAARATNTPDNTPPLAIGTGLESGTAVINQNVGVVFFIEHHVQSISLLEPEGHSWYCFKQHLANKQFEESRRAEAAISRTIDWTLSASLPADDPRVIKKFQAERKLTLATAQRVIHQKTVAEANRKESRALKALQHQPAGPQKQFETEYRRACRQLGYLKLHYQLLQPAFAPIKFNKAEHQQDNHRVWRGVYIVVKAIDRLGAPDKQIHNKQHWIDLATTAERNYHELRNKYPATRINVDQLYQYYGEVYFARQHLTDISKLARVSAQTQRVASPAAQVREEVRSGGAADNLAPREGYTKALQQVVNNNNNSDNTLIVDTVETAPVRSQSLMLVAARPILSLATARPVAAHLRYRTSDGRPGTVDEIIPIATAVRRSTEKKTYSPFTVYCDTSEDEVVRNSSGQVSGESAVVTPAVKDDIVTDALAVAGLGEEPMQVDTEPTAVQDASGSSAATGSSSVSLGMSVDNTSSPDDGFKLLSKPRDDITDQDLEDNVNLW